MIILFFRNIILKKIKMILSEESKNNPEQTLETLLTETDEDEPDKLTIVPFRSNLNDKNSFINVIINSFFYKKEIMQFFETEEPPMQDSYRLLYELQTVFELMKRLTSPIYYKKTARKIVDTQFVKHELSYQFNGKFFNPYQTGNASDILNIFYNALHAFFNGEDDIIAKQNIKCNNKNCLSHNLAYIDIASQIYCSICKKKGTLYKYPLDTYYYAIDTNSILVKLYENNDNNLFINKLFELEKIIHDETFQNEENETFVCDCRVVNKNNFKNYLIMLQSHKYFTISLLWQEPPKFEDICRVFLTLPQYFKNTDLFHVYNDFDVKEYIMQGLIVVDTNSNKHASFFIGEIEKNELYEKLEWYCCNENETKIMSSYIEVVEWCLFNNFYPVLLFYMYLNKDKTKEAKNIEFSKEQINKYIHHCALVDKINSITYTNLKLKKETLHPTIKDIYTTYDSDLIDKINEIKQDETKGIKKFNYVEELEQEKEKEALEEVAPKEEIIQPQILIKPRNLEKFNKDKKDYFFKKDIKIETFRKYPYKREGDWICSNCENINNPSTFECVKCKLIDMGIFAKIDEEKTNKMKQFNEDMTKKNNLRSVRNKSGNKRKNQFDQYTKKCLNCGNYYINKCFRCSKSNENSKGTFSQIRDENEMDQIKFVYNRASKTIRNEKKNRVNSDIFNEWICKYCLKKNSGKDQFCIKCKFNK